MAKHTYVSSNGTVLEFPNDGEDATYEHELFIFNLSWYVKLNKLYGYHNRYMQTKYLENKAEVDAEYQRRI